MEADTFTIVIICMGVMGALLIAMLVILLKKEPKVSGMIFLLAGLLVGWLILNILSNSVARADDVNDVLESSINGRGEAQSLASDPDSADTISSILRTNPSEDIVPGLTTTNPSQTALTPEALGDAHTATLDDAGDHTRGVITNPDRVTHDITDGSIDGALVFQADPTSIEGFSNLLSSQYEDCTTTTVPSTQAEQHFCDGWRNQGEETCRVNVNIQDDAEYNWTCERDAPKKIVECTRILVKSCTVFSRTHHAQTIMDNIEIFQTQGRGSARYVLGQTNRTIPGGRPDGSDFTYPYGFTIGTSRQQGLWSGAVIGGITFDLSEREYSFLDSFKLTYILWDDYAGVKVNDNLIWGNFTGRGELGREFSRTLDIDFREHLKVGENTITIYYYNGRYGRVRAYFRSTSTRCQYNGGTPPPGRSLARWYQEEWVETCSE